MNGGQSNAPTRAQAPRLHALGNGMNTHHAALEHRKENCN
jgi:hypothetical protein